MTKKGTQMVVSEDSQLYKLPDKCRGSHKFRDAKIHITFLNEDIFSPYFPDQVFHKFCSRCGMRE